MLPTIEEFLTQQRVRLFSNIAKIDEIQGRLEAYLQVFPGPRIEWDFEVLGNDEGYLRFSFLPQNAKPIEGHFFSIPKPKQSGWNQNKIGPRTAIRGVAGEALFGSEITQAHNFCFVVANTRFHQQANPQCDESFKSETGDQSIRVQLDSTWTLRLITRKAALEWLDPKLQNTGSQVTTVAHLFQHAFDPDKPETIELLQTMSILDAVRRAEQLRFLFWFANAGQLGPLYIEGKSISAVPLSENTVAAIAMVWQTTPIEQLGHSWINTQSDLAAYLGCYQTLERMLKTSHWEGTLYSVLTWYEQAMQDKAWQIIANALGTLLETLSYIILVLDESNLVTKADHNLLFQQKANRQDREKRWNIGNKPSQERSPTELRLKVVLERIGLTFQRGHNDVNDVHEFYGIRNDATHPTATGQGQNRRNELLNQARMWVDEILLWRLGYNGIYTNRCQNQDLTGPRYDLSNRDLNW